MDNTKTLLSLLRVRVYTMAAPPLTVGLVKAGQIPAASGDSQIYATVSWGDAAAESTRVTAGVAQEDWGASVDLPQPSSGLEQAVTMHPYFSIDIFAADLVGSTLRARLLLPIMSLAQTPQLKARWTMGPGPGVQQCVSPRQIPGPVRSMAPYCFLIDPEYT